VCVCVCVAVTHTLHLADRGARVLTAPRHCPSRRVPRLSITRSIYAPHSRKLRSRCSRRSSRMASTPLRWFTLMTS